MSLKHISASHCLDSRGVPEIPINGHQSPLSLPPPPHSLPRILPKPSPDRTPAPRKHGLFFKHSSLAWKCRSGLCFDGMVIWCHVAPPKPLRAVDCCFRHQRGATLEAKNISE